MELWDYSTVGVLDEERTCPEYSKIKIGDKLYMQVYLCFRFRLVRELETFRNRFGNTLPSEEFLELKPNCDPLDLTN